MRTGKTRAALAYLDGKARRILIVCPISAAGGWERDFPLIDRAGASLHPLYYGLVSHRAQVIGNLAAIRRRDPDGHPIQMVITNYNSYWREPLRTALLKWQPDAIVLDEAQRISHMGTKQTRFAHVLGRRDFAKRRIVLSGSLILKGPDRLNIRYEKFYSLRRFVDPKTFDMTWADFETRYLVLGGYEGRQVKKYINEDEIKRAVFEFGYWQSKEDCFDLPPAFDVPIPVPLSDKSRKIYDAIKKEGIAQIDQDGVHDLALSTIVLTTILRLHQVTSGIIKLESGEVADIGSEKLGICLDLVQDSIESGEKVVIFCRFIRDVERVTATLKRAGYGVDTLVGGMSKKARDAILPGSAWKADNPILVSQVDVGSLGLDMRAAGVCIYYSTGYGLDSFVQSRERLTSGNVVVNGVRGPVPPGKVVYYHLQGLNSVDESLFETLKNGQTVTGTITDKESAKKFLGAV